MAMHYPGLLGSLLVATLTGSVLVSAAQASVITIRFNDYDGGAFTHPEIIYDSFADTAFTTPVEGFDGLGVGANTFSGNMLRYTSGESPQPGLGAALSNLPEGGLISMSFLFAAIDSWDGDDPVFGPDVFEVVFDDAVIWSTSISNFPASSSGGGVLLGTGLFGFNASFPDSAWDFTSIPQLQNIGYSGTTATFLLRASGAGWQGGDNESWAIDNFLLTVTTTQTVPEPASLALLGLGLAALACTRRRTQGLASTRSRRGH